MSTQKPGSPDGTQDQSIRIGSTELERLRQELSDLATTVRRMQSRIHSVAQTVESWELYGEDYLAATAPSIGIPEEWTLVSSSSTTPLKRAERSSYARGRWMPSPAGGWEYERSPSTAPGSPAPRST